MSFAVERAFDHIVIVIFENQYRSYVKANAYMHGLAEAGTELLASFGISHPSHANYVASQAGQLCNVTHDPVFNSFIPGMPQVTPPAPLPQVPLVDRIAQKGLGWKGYFEDYKPVEFPPQLDVVMCADDPSQIDYAESVRHTILDYMPYMNLHNPFVRFSSVMTNPQQWARIRPLHEIFSDALNGTLPECSWVVPHLWGDGHYLWGSIEEGDKRAPGLVDQQARWLETFFGILRIPGPQARLPERTLVIVTYDEADFEADYIAAQAENSDYDGPNQIFTVLLGDVARTGLKVREGCNHYTILRTIEKNFGLDDLGANDAEANWLQFLWGRSFRWGAPAATPAGAASFVAAAGRNGALDVVYGDGGVRMRTFDGSHWGEEQTVPAPPDVTAVELCALDDTLLLVVQSGGALQAMTFAGEAWSQPQTVAGAASGSFAVAAYRDYHDSTVKAMLVWVAEGGRIQSRIFAGGAWSAPADTGQQTDGDLTVAVLGASLFLIAKAAGSDTMNVTSYNTADCNVITGTSNGYSDTTLGAWSPSSYPVAHFGRGPRHRDVEREPMLRPYPGVAPFANATLEGVVHLVTNGGDGGHAITTTFSLSGMLTPLHPVDYGAGSTGSNGYGTLAQGGWTRQEPVAGVQNAAAMAMARFGERLALLSRTGSGGALQLTIGGYA